MGGGGVWRANAENKKNLKMWQADNTVKTGLLTTNLSWQKKKKKKKKRMV